MKYTKEFDFCPLCNFKNNLNKSSIFCKKHINLVNKIKSGGRYLTDNEVIEYFCWLFSDEGKYILECLIYSLLSKVQIYNQMFFNNDKRRDTFIDTLVKKHNINVDWNKNGYKIKSIKISKLIESGKIYNPFKDNEWQIKNNPFKNKDWQIKTHKYLKDNNLGSFYNEEKRKFSAKRGLESQKVNKTGFYNSENFKGGFDPKYCGYYETNKSTDGKIMYQYGLELKFLKFVENNIKIKSIKRGPVLKYQTCDEKWHNYFLDFEIEYFDGHIELIECKAYDMLGENNNLDKIRCGSIYGKVNNKKYRLIHEHNFHKLF